MLSNAVGKHLDDRLKNDAAVRTAERGFTSPLRVRHQTHHVSRAIADAGDVVDRPIGISLIPRNTAGIGVSKDDLAMRIELRDRLRIGEVVAFPVRDWQLQNLAWPAQGGEWRIGMLDANV